MWKIIPYVMFISELLLCCALFFAIVLIIFYRQWHQIPYFTANTDVLLPQLNQVSIIIAAKNEENNIIACIDSIEKNISNSITYEIIVVDDNSQDATYNLLQERKASNPSLQIYQTSPSLQGKKNALKLAISNAKYDYILCTDADCMVGHKWVETHLSFAHIHQKSISTSLISFPYPQSLLDWFQYMDVMVTMVLTCVGIEKKWFTSGNGANISYFTSVWTQYQYRRKDWHIASGDDIFLIDQIATDNSSNVGFLKSLDSMVTTNYEKSYSDLWEQRKRWANKSLHSHSKILLILQAFLFTQASLLCLGLIVNIVIGFSSILYWLLGFLIIFAAKYFFIRNIAKERKVSFPLSTFILLFWMYQVYIIWAGITALIKVPFKWKGITHKQ